MPICLNGCPHVGRGGISKLGSSRKEHSTRVINVGPAHFLELMHRMVCFCCVFLNFIYFIIKEKT